MSNSFTKEIIIQNGNAWGTITGTLAAQTDLQALLNDKIDASLAVQILSTTNSINAKTIAKTTLYTVPVGNKCVITGATIRCTAATAVTISPTLGIGSDTNAVNIIAAAPLTGLTDTTKFFSFVVSGATIIGNAGDVIKTSITVGATATTMTISIDLNGYLV